MPTKELEEAANAATRAVARLRDVARHYVEVADAFLSGHQPTEPGEEPARPRGIGNRSIIEILEQASQPLTSREIHAAAKRLPLYPFSRALKRGCTQEESELAHLRKSLTIHSREAPGKRTKLTLKIVNGRVGLKDWPDSMWASMPEVPQEEMNWIARSETESE
jgi:hypothetical protein